MNLTTVEFDVIRKLVREQAGIVIEAGKEYLVESRMAALLRNDEFESIEALVKCLERGTIGASEKVVDALTTNETSFFRDGTPFEVLKERIIPAIIDRCRDRRELEIWCAASSSGQEPVSLGIHLLEHFPELREWDVRILATDISETMLERCRTGIYSQLEVSRGLPASLLIRYFEKQGVKWKVGAAVHDMIEYAPLNLTRAFPVLPVAELVMIRNVLIYFDEETKLGILERIHRSMRPDGYLMLGTAETARNTSFRRVTSDLGSYYRSAP